MKFLLIVLTTHLIGELIARNTKGNIKTHEKDDHGDKWVGKKMFAGRQNLSASKRRKTNSGKVRPVIHPAEHSLR